LNCNSEKAVAKYEAGKFSLRKPKTMTKGTNEKELGWYCSKCDYARPIQLSIPLFWVTCRNCNMTLVSKVRDRCNNCEVD
jgi:hypothetical protein